MHQIDQNPTSKPVVVIAGTASGVGKTSIAVGLMAALRDTGLRVQAFKVGPDFIDPMHHEKATGRPSINLDGWMLSRAQVLATFNRHMANADIGIVEGVMGLFDGRDGATEDGSTAQIAKWLGAPVILIIDCSAIARSAAALVKGYQDFDPALKLGALIFNKVGGVAHTKWLAEAITASGLGIDVLGGISKDSAIAMQERYLGLHMPTDPSMPENLVNNLANLVRSSVDLEAVLQLASTAVTVPAPNSISSEDGDEYLETGYETTKSEAFHDALEAAASGSEKDAEVTSSESRSAMKKSASEDSVYPPAPISPSPGSPAAKLGAANGSDIASPLDEEEQLPASDNSSSSADADQKSADKPDTGPAGQRKRKKKRRGGHVAAAAEAINNGTAAEEQQRPPLSAIHVTRKASLNEQLPASPLGPPPPGPPVRIAVAKDAAFCFYYHDNLALLREAGAELVPFSPLHEALPHGVSGVYLGGGYPERYAAELADNKPLRAGLKAFAQSGGVIYAECGGLLLLSQSLQPRGEPPQPMVGIFPFRAVLPHGKYTMGYVEVETTAHCPIFPAGRVVRGHVHHCSEIVEEHHLAGVVDGESSSQHHNWKNGYLLRPQAPGAPQDTSEGFSAERVLGSYVHLHFGGCPDLAVSLVERCRGVDVAAVNAAVSIAEDEAHMLEGSCVHITPPASMHRGSMGLAGVRSSPDFSAVGRGSVDQVYQQHNNPYYRPVPSGRQARSMDMLRHYHGATHEFVGHHHQQQGGFQRVPSAGNNSMNKILSSGSLSNMSQHQQQQYYHGYPPQHHYHGDHMSQRSNDTTSPMQLSPRAGLAATADTSSFYAYGGASGYGGSVPHSLHEYGSPTTAGVFQVERRSSSFSQGQQQPPQQQGSNAPPPGLPARPRHIRTGSHPSQQPQPLPLPPHMQQQELDDSMTMNVPVKSGSGKFGSVFPGKSLDLSLVTRTSTGVAFAASGSATPHNWQHSYPPSDKIVSLGPGATEMAYALGLGKRLVAVSDDCDYPPEVLTKAKVALRPTDTLAAAPGIAVRRDDTAHVENSTSGVSPMATSSDLNEEDFMSTPTGFITPSSNVSQRSYHNGTLVLDEQVLARERPGLIIYEDESLGAGGLEDTPLGAAVLDAVVSVGLQQSCRVVCVRRSSLGDVLNSMLTVGEAAGVGEEAARTVDRARARLRRVAGEVARVGTRPKILVLSSLNPIRTVGLWAPDAAVLGGATDGLQQPGDAPRSLTWEEIVQYAPDVLIIADSKGGNTKKVFNDLCQLASQPGWWLLPAVKASAVFVCDKSLFCRAGPRLVDGVESLARMVHGDAISVCCPTRMVLKLSLRPGQRCRQRLLPNYFMAYC